MSGAKAVAKAPALKPPVSNVLLLSLGAGRYQLKHKIGSGSFGEIYLGVDTRTHAKVAVKLETLTSKYPQLEYEYRVYQSIKATEGLAQVHWYGTTPTHNVMVMDLLGETLETLYTKCKRKFSLKTVLMLAVQLLNRLEHHHNNHYLHRDIKPDNFLMGLDPGTQHLVYIIDMGLCKRYRDPKTREHIQFKENKKMIGTPRYASVNAHIGIEQSRRDDLESMGYLLVYFMAGELPWQGLQARTKQEKYDKISHKKTSTPIPVLCQGMPAEFCTYLRYTRELKFEEEPDYNYMRGLFYSLYRRNNFADDWTYDWTPKGQKAPGKFLPVEPPAPPPPTSVTSAGGTVTTLGLPKGYSAVPISHIGAASIPGAILDEVNRRICLPPGYTFLPKYEVVLPPGAVFEEKSSSIRYEGRLYPILPPSHTPMQIQAQQAMQKMQLLQAQTAAAKTRTTAAAPPAQPTAVARTTTPPASVSMANSMAAAAAAQQTAATAAAAQRAAAASAAAASALAAQRSTSNLSVQIPQSASPSAARAVSGNGTGSGSSANGPAPMAVGGQTPVPMSSPLDSRVAKREIVTVQRRRPATPPAVAPSSSNTAAATATATASTYDPHARHKQELQQWMEAYEEMEAERDKWRKKYDDVERTNTTKTSRLDEYERLVQRLRQELAKQKEHNDLCPAAKAPQSLPASPVGKRKRKHEAITPPAERSVADSTRSKLAAQQQHYSPSGVTTRAAAAR